MNSDLQLIDGYEIGKRIEKLIEESGYTKTEVARQLGISATSVYKWVEAESIPDIQHLLDLSFLLDVSIDYIVQGEKNFLTINDLRKVLRKDVESCMKW